ncbi:MAG: hypothetical protein O2875_02495 [Planctomycetota bacterium]|nr:hypothetical protein [Planctomycetota bacterium]MDA1261753.1 hypothetical protein [Planctomycetota bacterium]
MQLPPSVNVHRPATSISFKPSKLRAIIFLLLIIPIVAFFFIAGFFFLALFVAIIIAIAFLVTITRIVRSWLNGAAQGRPSIPQRDSEGRENVRVIRPN